MNGAMSATLTLDELLQRLLAGAVRVTTAGTLFSETSDESVSFTATTMSTSRAVSSEDDTEDGGALDSV